MNFAISQDVSYALRGLACLAKNPDKNISVKEVAVIEDISDQFLAKIFQKLEKKKFIKSVRGRNGGFRLVKDPKKLSLLMILEALGVCLELRDCECCSRKGLAKKKCGFKKIWERSKKELEKIFAEVKLAELI